MAKSFEVPLVSSLLSKELITIRRAKKQNITGLLGIKL